MPFIFIIIYIFQAAQPPVLKDTKMKCIKHGQPLMAFIIRVKIVDIIS